MDKLRSSLMRSALLCVIVGLMLFGCGHKEAGIVGEWQGTYVVPAVPGAMAAISETASVTFRAGGTGSMTTQTYLGTITSEFTYEENGSSITLTPKPSSPAPSDAAAALVQPVTYTCTKTAGSLTLKDPADGVSLNLARR